MVLIIQFKNTYEKTQNQTHEKHYIASINLWLYQFLSATASHLFINLYVHLYWWNYNQIPLHYTGFNSLCDSYMWLCVLCLCYVKCVFYSIAFNAQQSWWQCNLINTYKKHVSILCAILIWLGGVIYKFAYLNGDLVFLCIGVSVCVVECKRRNGLALSIIKLPYKLYDC